MHTDIKAFCLDIAALLLVALLAMIVVFAGARMYANMGLAPSDQIEHEREVEMFKLRHEANTKP